LTAAGRLAGRTARQCRAAPQAGVITWRRLYVPQVGHAVCGSFGSRHCGHCTSTGAVAFHFARRERVLLRDILRLGTATSVLLTCLRHGQTVRSFLSRDLPQSCPPGVQGRAVVVSGARLGKPRATLSAQPGAVFLASRRERQRENQGISEGWLKIKQVPVQRVPVLATVPAVLVITEQFPALDCHRLGYWLKAPCALAHHRRGRGDRGKHALGDRLEADLQVQVRAFGDPGHAGMQVRGSGRGPGLGARRPRAAVKATGIENKRPAGIGAGAGCPSG
jgi:hypothetical protein